MKQEVRCSNKLHYLLIDGLIEVKCNSKFCGAGPGIVVLHRFDPNTGELVDTRKYQEPPRKGEVSNGSASSNPSVRLSGYQADSV